METYGCNSVPLSHLCLIQHEICFRPKSALLYGLAVKCHVMEMY